MSAPPTSDSPHALDLIQVRRRFARAARDDGAHAQAATLPREIAQRMLERLDYVKLDPGVVIDAGCGTGDAIDGLAKRFPQAHLLAVDFVPSMLARIGSSRGAMPGWIDRLLRPRRVSAIAADIAKLPLREATIGCIWSNLALHWSNDPPNVFAEWHRVLKVGGLAQFSLLGPDTLQELRAASGRSGTQRVHRFVDMHDIGDMLVQAGFADPVMDMETITLTYRSADDMFGELRAAGAANASAHRSRGLTGRRRWQALCNALEATRRNGTLPATFEVIYGHAWKPLPRAGRDGVAIAIVRVEDIGRRRA